MIGDERTITIRCIGTYPDGREVWSIKVSDLPDHSRLHFDQGPGDILYVCGGEITEETGR